VTISTKEWDEAARTLRDASTVALACHVGPDGDALGSMLALGIALHAQGTKVAASWGSDPFEAPRQYSFLPGLDLLVPPGDIDAAPGVMATFDAGSMDRLGSLDPNARSAGSLIVVDHHASNDRFGTINLVDPHAAASAVLVYELLGRMGLEIDTEIATCLYVGLVTDTGRFQYANTTPHVHHIAADLIARGAPHVDITRTIYDTHPVGYLKLAADVLARLAQRPDASMVWSWFTQADLRTHGVGMDDTEALIDLVRTVDDADVALLLKEQPDGRYKISMRSKGAADVGAVCEAMGGGGHALAAGYTAAETDPSVIVDAIAAALRA